jgi:hypothetical protein
VSLFSAVADFLKPEPPLDPTVAKALDRVAELTAPAVKLAPDFAKHLALPVQYALGYCDGLIASLPGPIDINRRAFAIDPLVHALFAAPGDIDQMLGRSQAVRDFLALAECWESEYFYAMFVARRQQKRQFGMRQQGDVIQSDVPQKILYFSDHTLVAPSCHLEQTQKKLRSTALDSLLHTFHDHVAALRNEREGLRSDISVERAHLTVLRGATPGREFEVRTRHLAELDGRLRETADSLGPTQLLASLGEFLLAPEQALRLSPCSITVDRLGVVQEEATDDMSVNTLSFPELTSRDQRLYLAMLARISREEAREAVEMVRDQQHRFMLI